MKQFIRRRAVWVALALVIGCGLVGAAQIRTRLFAPADEIVATVDGVPITTRELDQYASSQDPSAARILRQQQFELRDRMLDQLIAERLLERKAQESGTSVAELVQAGVNASEKVTEEEILALYNDGASATGVSLERARPTIVHYLEKQKHEDAKRRFIAELRARESARVSQYFDGPRENVPIAPSDPSKGSSDAVIEIVEFSDFECPYCRQVWPILDDLVRKFPETVRVVWKDSPLPIHPYAVPAAEAARCAAAQGRFWQYHDLLFANQRALSTLELRAYATSAGIDAAAFESCLTTRQYAADVAAAARTARDLEVNVTPTIFVNGRRVEGLRSLAEYERIVRMEIERVSP
jgi:predicted DsbA family dithiol-disulfide isomerase